MYVYLNARSVIVSERPRARLSLFIARVSQERERDCVLKKDISEKLRYSVRF